MSYVIVWEFRVRPEAEAQFIERYGPDGPDMGDPRRFLTLDYWQSEEELNRFREQNLAQYKKLERECELLTEMETCLGLFRPAKRELRF